MKGEAKEFSILSAAGAVIGTLIGLGLSFTALSPLVIGGVIAVVPAILFYAYSIYNSIREEKFSKEDLFAYAWLCAASAAIGVGLAAVCNCYFSWCNAWSGICSFNRRSDRSHSTNCRTSCNKAYHCTNS